MDYSPGDDSVSDAGGESFEEPEMINDAADSTEPEFTETSQEVDSVPLEEPEPETPVETPADTDVTYHSQPNGIEVLPSPETEPLEGPSVKDFGIHSGGPEGGY
jgi:hypothetical protein